MTRMPSPIVSAEELDRFMETEFAQVFIDGRIYTITDLGPGTLTMRLDPGERHLRPGGTVSGPTLFTLADYAAYCVILAHIGLKGLSVTTSFHINFMRKAEPGLQESLIDRFQLSKGDLSQKVKHLSHGTLQKLGIIQAFFHRPELLVLD